MHRMNGGVLSLSLSHRIFLEETRGQSWSNSDFVLNLLEEKKHEINYFSSLNLQFINPRKILFWRADRRHFWPKPQILPKQN